MSPEDYSVSLSHRFTKAQILMQAGRAAFCFLRGSEEKRVVVLGIMEVLHDPHIYRKSSFDVWSLILQSHTGTSQDKRSGTYETEVPNTNSKDRRKLRENHAYLQLLLDFDKKALFSFVWSPYPINIHTCLSIDFDHPYSFPLLKKIGLTSYFRYPCLLGPSICRCLDPYLRYKGALTFFQPALDMQSQRVLALVPSAWDCLSTPKSG